MLLSSQKPPERSTAILFYFMATAISAWKKTRRKILLKRAATIKKAVRDLIAISKAVENPHAADTKDPESMDEKELKKLAKELEKKMRQAAAELNFEEAASLRDRMIEVKKMLLDME